MSHLQSISIKYNPNLEHIFLRVPTTSFIQAKGRWWSTNLSSWQCQLSPKRTHPDQTGLHRFMWVAGASPPALHHQCPEKCIPSTTRHPLHGPGRRPTVLAGKLQVEYTVSCQHPGASSATAAYGFCQHSHALITGSYLLFISVWVDLIAPWAIWGSLAHDRLHPASQGLVRNIIWITVHFQDETLLMFFI